MSNPTRFRRSLWNRSLWIGVLAAGTLAHTHTVGLTIAGLSTAIFVQGAGASTALDTTTQDRLKSFGSRAKATLDPDGKLVEIVIQDGSEVTAADIELFSRLKDLKKLQVFNCRDLNDEMVLKLTGLSKLESLALTNTVITDEAVQTIVKAFPDLIELDLSSNTNMTSSAMRVIATLTKLQRLTLIQNRFNDLSARRLAKLEDLRTLDLRGNMEAGDMALEVIGSLPKLTALKHRSTAVTDVGLEQLAKSKTLNALLLQDFVITSESGKHLAKLDKLNSLEIFRCQGFGTEGVLALQGMKLNRLTLRDLPNIGDPALQVLAHLPALKRLYIHEIASVSDEGFKNLASAQALEVLDLWSLPKMTDATVDIIAALPNLKELSIRETGVSEASVAKILAMPKLQSLTFKNNGPLSDENAAKLKAKKWTKLDLGSSGPKESDAQ
ncbi:MAG: hypothetical protein MUF23_14245 [Pirellula sp.]|nr:hypothetical protein [Pirellula sp.]